MLLWRISRHFDLAGIGGMRAAGRWHYAGQPVVYLSESPAAALLEVYVHTAANDVPPSLMLLKIQEADVEVASVEIGNLGPGWRDNKEFTRDLGSRWLRDNQTVLLRVPSAIVPETSNYLFNPLHADAKGFVIAGGIGCRLMGG
jgi:RES domain-containing protein